MRSARKTRKPEDGTSNSLGFAARLEAEATRILERGQPDPAYSSLQATMDREIALTVDQLDQVRLLDDGLRRDLLRLECYIDTELMQMEQRTPRYSPYRFPEREKLQRRLQRIGEERRRLAISTHEKLWGLQDRLLTLVERRRQMNPLRRSTGS